MRSGYRSSPETGGSIRLVVDAEFCRVDTRFVEFILVFPSIN
jgi:hypothetical protein